MKILKMASLFALAIAVVISCKKEEEPNYSYNPGLEVEETYSSLSSYLDENKPVAQTFTVSAETGGVFTTGKGSILSIPPNSFMHYNGTLANGNVTLTVKEIFTNKEMMFSRIFPNSYGSILNSGGEFYIVAKQGSEHMTIPDLQTIQFKIPAQAEDPEMLLFFAGLEEEAPEEGMFNWGEQGIEGGDSTSFYSGFNFNSADNSYEINIDSMGWGNIDAFDWTIEYFDCTFNLTGLDGLDNSNTTAFAVFEESNAVWPVGVPSWGSIDDSVITESHLGAVPLNLLVISVIDGQLHYGLINITPVDGQDYDIPMIPVTSADLDAIISSLP